MAFIPELYYYVALEGASPATKSDLLFCQQCLEMLATEGDINKNEVLHGIRYHPNVFIWGKRNASILGAHCLFYKGDASLTFDSYVITIGLSNHLVDFVMGDGWWWSLELVKKRLEYVASTGNVLITKRLPFQMHAIHYPSIGWNCIEEFHIFFDKKLRT